MDLFTIASIIIVLSALFGYINVRFLKMPNTIGLMVIAIVFTLGLFASTLFTDRLLDGAERLISQIDFETVLLDIMLGFLLFAGALHTNFAQLRAQRWPILVFSTLGVLVSTFLCSGFIFFGFRLLGLEPAYMHCLLFGALISPTDPIAVLGILKKAGVPKILETKIVGESLFNDGVGVVVFSTLLAVATAGAPKIDVVDQGLSPVQQAALDENDSTASSAVPPLGIRAESSTEGRAGEEQPAEIEHAVGNQHDATTVSGVMGLFAQEVFGGLLLGLVLGYCTFLLMRSIDDYEIEVMITLACVMGGYSLAHWLHVSAPLAIVVAGLIVGTDVVRGAAMSKQTERYVDRFWELMDMLMNAMLFVLIGLELLVLSFNRDYFFAGLMAIVIVLVSRFFSLLAPVRFFAKRLEFVPHTTTIMTWGGLRGGISIALALSLPIAMNRDLFLTVTYCVVVFSIIVQGLTVGNMARQLLGSERMEPADVD